MMRPDDIPEDIWNDARKTWEAARLLTDKHGASVPGTYTLLISRAIMAATERERDEAAKRAGNYLMLKTPLDVPRIVACEEAIRQPANSNFKSVPVLGDVS